MVAFYLVKSDNTLDLLSIEFTKKQANSMYYDYLRDYGQNLLVDMLSPLN